MSTINALTVLNTVADNSADVHVDASGNLNITGLPSIKANRITAVKKTSSVAEQIKKQLVTFTAANSYTYNLNLVGFAYSSTADPNVPVLKTVPVSYTSDSTATADEVSAGITAAVAVAAAGFNVTAADQGSSSGAVLFTAVTGFPTFYIESSDTTNIAIQTVCTVAFTASPSGNTATGLVVVAGAGTVSSILITNGGEGYASAPTVTFTGGASNTSGGATATAVITKGVVTSVTITGAGSGNKSRIDIAAVGTTAKLQFKFGGTTEGGGLTSKYYLSGLSNLTAGATYQEWDIDFVNYTGNPTYAEVTNKETFVVLINDAATASGSDTATISLALLNDINYGSLTLLQAGYRSTVTPSATTQALITVTTGVVTLDGGSQTYGTLGAMPNDYLVISQAGGTAFTTLYTTKLQSMGATQLLAIGDNIVALPATSEDFKFIAVRNIPN